MEKETDQWLSGKASATETIDSGSIPGQVKLKTKKIGIYRELSNWRLEKLVFAESFQTKD